MGPDGAARAWSRCAQCSPGRLHSRPPTGRTSPTPTGRWRWRAGTASPFAGRALHAALGGSSPGHLGSPPKFPSDYAAFMRQLVQRYGPGARSGERPNCLGARSATGSSGTSPTSTSTGTRRTRLSGRGSTSSSCGGTARDQAGRSRSADRAGRAGRRDSKVLTAAYEPGARGALRRRHGPPLHRQAGIRDDRRPPDAEGAQARRRAAQADLGDRDHLPGGQGPRAAAREEWQRRWYTTRAVWRSGSASSTGLGR